MARGLLAVLLTLGVAALIGLAGELSAQEARVITPGERVRLDPGDGVVTYGTLISFTTTEFALQDALGEIRVILRSEAGVIEVQERRQGFKRRFLPPFIAGVVVGAGVAAATWQPCDNCFVDVVGSRGAAAGLGAGVGAILGGAVGLIRYGSQPRDRWEPGVLPDRMGERLTLTPLLGPAWGISGSLRVGW